MNPLTRVLGRFGGNGKAASAEKAAEAPKEATPDFDQLWKQFRAKVRENYPSMSITERTNKLQAAYSILKNAVNQQLAIGIVQDLLVIESEPQSLLRTLDEVLGYEREYLDKPEEKVPASAQAKAKSVDTKDADETAYNGDQDALDEDAVVVTIVVKGVKGNAKPEELSNATIKQGRHLLARTDPTGNAEIAPEFDGDKPVVLAIDKGLGWREKTIKVGPGDAGRTFTITLYDYPIVRNGLLVFSTFGTLALAIWFFLTHPAIAQFIPGPEIVWGFYGFVAVALMFNSIRSVAAWEWVDFVVPFLWAPSLWLATFGLPNGRTYNALRAVLQPGDTSTAILVFVAILLAVPFLVTSGMLIFAVIIQNNRRVMQQMPAYVCYGTALAADFAFHIFPTYVDALLFMLLGLSFVLDLIKHHKQVFTSVALGGVMILVSAAALEDGLQLLTVQFGVLGFMLLLTLAVVAYGMLVERKAGHDSVERVTTGPLDFIPFRIPLLVFFTFYFVIHLIK